MEKAKAIGQRIKNKGSIIAIVSAIHIILVEMGVVTLDQQNAILANAEYILGLLVAFGLVKVHKDVVKEKEDEIEAKQTVIDAKQTVIDTLVEETKEKEQQ